MTRRLTDAKDMDLSTLSLPTAPMQPLMNFSTRVIRYNTTVGPIELWKKEDDLSDSSNDINIKIQPGMKVAVVGPSGCGKSTLLRIASNLETNTGGKCSIDRNSIGYVFQDATLMPWRTVARNVELIAELHKLPKSARQQLSAEAIELVGLSGFEDKYPRQLSGGMRMRASLARSLVMKPKVFLFDEPFGALDEITRERLNDELLRLFQHEGFAGLFITHSITEAVYMSTKVLVMSARPGKIIASFDVPFSYPRNHDLRYEAEFAELCGKISHALRGAHE